ncbi:hypothetical protein ACWDUI_33155, partial [Streptosporangium sandarakinum]
APASAPTVFPAPTVSPAPAVEPRTAGTVLPEVTAASLPEITTASPAVSTTTAAVPPAERVVTAPPLHVHRADEILPAALARTGSHGAEGESFPAAASLTRAEETDLAALLARVSETAESWLSGASGGRSPDVPESWFSPMPESRSAAVSESWFSPVPESRSGAAGDAPGAGDTGRPERAPGRETSPVRRHDGPRVPYQGRRRLREHPAESPAFTPDTPPRGRRHRREHPLETSTFVPDAPLRGRRHRRSESVVSTTVRLGPAVPAARTRPGDVPARSADVLVQGDVMAGGDALMPGGYRGRRRAKVPEHV